MEYSISEQAVEDLTDFAREVSGDETLGFRFAILDGPTSRYDRENHRIEVDQTVLMRNPNGVLHVVTPFRMKQEAAITGAILHEVSRIKHSTLHEQEASVDVMALARVLEETRLDNLVRGPEGLAWTVKAAAAKSVGGLDWESDSLMDVLVRTVLTAGRFVFQRSDLTPRWASEDWAGLLNQMKGETERWGEAFSILESALTSPSETASMDAARRLIEALFPEGAPTPPQPGQAGEGSESDEEAEERMEDAASEASENEGRPDPWDVDSITASAMDKGEKAEHLAGLTRNPSGRDRVVQEAASKFLRSLVDPTETVRRVVDDSPSSEVDPVALAVWRASGGVKDPRFFIRTRREVTTAPPVKIALITDISGSMDPLQPVSAQMAWALSAAARDLANFAGAGANVEVAHVLWGSGTYTVQEPGEFADRITHYRCSESTVAMPQAIRKADDLLGGSLLNPPGRPENRLIIHFSDWVVTQKSKFATDFAVENLKALGAGCKVLSVAPATPNLTGGYIRADEVLRIASQNAGLRGFRQVEFKQNPEDVWATAIDTMKG